MGEEEEKQEVGDKVSEWTKKKEKFSHSDSDFCSFVSPRMEGGREGDSGLSGRSGSVAIN